MAVTSAYADIDDASRNVGAIPFDQADAGGSQGPTGDGAPFGPINGQTASPGLSVDQQRALAETASAYSYAFPKFLEARSRFRNDIDYPTLPQRWANESEQIIDAGVSRISDDGVRANVRRRLQITITRSTLRSRIGHSAAPPMRTRQSATAFSEP